MMLDDQSGQVLYMRETDAGSNPASMAIVPVSVDG